VDHSLKSLIYLICGSQSFFESDTNLSLVNTSRPKLQTSHVKMKNVTIYGYIWQWVAKFVVKLFTLNDPFLTLLSPIVDHDPYFGNHWSKYWLRWGIRATLIKMQCVFVLNHVIFEIILSRVLKTSGGDNCSVAYWLFARLLQKYWSCKVVAYAHKFCGLRKLLKFFSAWTCRKSATDLYKNCMFLRTGFCFRSNS